MGKSKAPKKYHSTAGKDVHDLVYTVATNHHNFLTDSNILVLFKHGDWKSKGKRQLGKVRVLSDDLRRTLKQDAIIYINKDWWDIATDPQKEYLIDHELCHLDISEDRHGDTILHDDGRPKLTTVPHDLEDFFAVVKRHGLIMEDVKKFAKVMTEARQMTLEEVLRFAPTEGAADAFKEQVKAAEETKPEEDKPQQDDSFKPDWLADDEKPIGEAVPGNVVNFATR